MNGKRFGRRAEAREGCMIERLEQQTKLTTNQWKLIVTGKQNVDPRRPTIYVCNHQSTLDIPVIFMAVPTAKMNSSTFSRKRPAFQS